MELFRKWFSEKFDSRVEIIKYPNDDKNPEQFFIE